MEEMVKKGKNVFWGLVVIVSCFVIYDEIKKGNVAPWLKNGETQIVSTQDKTAEAATETSNQPFEVIDLGWRDVEEVKEVGLQAIVLFRNNPSVPSSADGNNTRIATFDLAHSLADGYWPLITKDRKKAYILQIDSNPRSKYFGHSMAQVSYIVKVGNLQAELSKAGLPW